MILPNTLCICGTENTTKNNNIKMNCTIEALCANSINFVFSCIFLVALLLSDNIYIYFSLSFLAPHILLCGI